MTTRTRAGEGRTGRRLARDEVWTSPVGMRGLALACGEGSVWLTQEGDPEDHVVRAGERFQVAGPGRVVVQALRPARVSLEPRDPDEAARVREGLGWGALAVLAFSFTLPATRVAVPELGSVVVGLGRAVVAAVLAAGLLLVRRERLPERRYWPRLALVAAGVVVGFPLFSALALRHLHAAHGSVLVGLLPAATAVAAVFRARERPSRSFWLAVAVGLCGVVAFALARGAGRPSAGDGWLLLAVAAGAVGYAEGGALARELGGWRVICWALVFTAPLLVPVVAFAVEPGWQDVSAKAWLGLGYVSSVSMFLGFFAWYRAMALGGVARVSQLQLAQPLLSLTWSAWLLGETVGRDMLFAAVGVMACVLWSVRGRVDRQASSSAHGA